MGYGSMLVIHENSRAKFYFHYEPQHYPFDLDSERTMYSRSYKCLVDCELASANPGYVSRVTNARSNRPWNVSGLSGILYSRSFGGLRANCWGLFKIRVVYSQCHSWEHTNIWGWSLSLGTYVDGTFPKHQTSMLICTDQDRSWWE